MKPGQLVLDGSNSRCYRCRAGQPKHARICWTAAEYTLAWGRQRFDEPHVRVTDAGGDYGVDLHTFFRTHRAVPEREDHYVKVVKVWALCVTEQLELITMVNGTVEMSATVPAGAFVVENPDGERYAMSAEDFMLRYEPDGE
jgi:hypothetical protein